MSKSVNLILITSDKKINLNEMSDYIGELNDNLNQYQKDLLIFNVWISQYKQNDEFSTPRYDCDKSCIEEIQKCGGDWKDRSNWPCNKYDDDFHKNCENCSNFIHITRKYRGDDYYLLKEKYPLNKDIIENNQNYITTISEGRSYKYIDNASTYVFCKYAGNLFKNHNNIIEIIE